MTSGRPQDTHDSQPDGPAVGPTDLAHLASLLRSAVATLDAEARERLEAAWVALTSALKQPQHDAARITARLARLRGEIDRIIAAQLPGGSPGADPDETSEEGPR